MTSETRRVVRTWRWAWRLSQRRRPLWMQALQDLCRIAVAAIALVATLRGGWLLVDGSYASGATFLGFGAVSSFAVQPDPRGRADLTQPAT